MLTTASIAQDVGLKLIEIYMQNEKQRVKRQAKKKVIAEKKTAKKSEIKRKVEQAKTKYAQIKEQRRAEVKLISYMYKIVNGRMPEENESLDSIEIKALCKKFIKNGKEAAYYTEVAKFAENKIVRIEQIEAQEKKLSKLTKKK